MNKAAVKRRFLLSLCLCLAVVAGIFQPAIVFGDIYRYIDDKGVIHFTNIPSGPGYTLYIKEKPKVVRKKKRTPVDIGKVTALVKRYATRYGLEEELVNAVIKVESDYDASAVSSKGAQGLMQLMAETARDMDVADPFDMEDNIRGGSRYLRLMLDLFEGNVDLALAAYNAGPSAVQRYGGIPPYNETLRYVEKVKEQYTSFRGQKGKKL
ncbi:MAG: lytic transglycosylase domain-containing protein [Desulfuromonadaceae bacterium]|nr:lytic transglycosylase domain-containing protein [Desulfuromonadaceae bacterium]